MNIYEREASQFADSSTNVEWWEPVLERLGYITREPSLSGQAPPYQERTNRYRANLGQSSQTLSPRFISPVTQATKKYTVEALIGIRSILAALVA
jgi:hypothetical protein